jgi:molecular chaperone IbpA
MTQLTRFDTAALNKALIGFDRIFNDMDRRFSNQNSTNYPPYNVEKINENTYEISIAVTGFNKNEVHVSLEGNHLSIKGERLREEDPSAEYLYRGLALRDFERVFTLAEHMKVCGAKIKNGILSIQIEREIPESMKPRVINIVEVE